MTIGDRIKRLRKECGLTADELGKMIGKDRSTIYRYERGDVENATVAVISRLAKALHTTPQEILGWDDKPAYYWVDPTRAGELSELAEQWYNWTRGHRWTKREFEVFAAQAEYIMKIKGSKEYDAMMNFLDTIYTQLNKTKGTPN